MTYQMQSDQPIEQQHLHRPSHYGYGNTNQVEFVQPENERPQWGNANSGG